MTHAQTIAKARRLVEMADQDQWPLEQINEWQALQRHVPDIARALIALADAPIPNDEAMVEIVAIAMFEADKAMELDTAWEDLPDAIESGYINYKRQYRRLASTAIAFINAELKRRKAT